MQIAIETRLNFSTAYLPQTNGQSEKTIQMLGDILRACVLDLSRSWETYLLLVEFAYNNSYEVTIQMAPTKLCMKESVDHLFIRMKLMNEES